MTNKPSKKEEGLERIVQLICVAIAVFGILLFSSCYADSMCEDCYTYTYSDGSTEWMCVEYDCSTDTYSQDLGFTKANANTYYNYETLVDGVVYERDFDAYWEITDNVVRFQKDEGNGIETYIQFAISRYEGDVMYLLSGTTEIPYQFSSGENGDLIMTHMSGEYVITYKLSI